MFFKRLNGRLQYELYSNIPKTKNRLVLGVNRPFNGFFSSGVNGANPAAKPLHPAIPNVTENPAS